MYMLNVSDSNTRASCKLVECTFDNTFEVLCYQSKHEIHICTLNYKNSVKVHNLLQLHYYPRNKAFQLKNVQREEMNTK